MFYSNKSSSIKKEANKRATLIRVGQVNTIISCWHINKLTLTLILSCVNTVFFIILKVYSSLALNTHTDKQWVTGGLGW